MSQRAAELAAGFERVNGEVVGAVEQLSAEQWGTVVPGEGWTVGVVVHHVAVAHELIGGWVQALVRGEEPRPSYEEIDAINAEHARQYAACTREETVELLRRNGDQAAGLVRGLDDAELDRTGTFRGQPISAAGVIERILTGHPQRHLASIRAALAGTA